MKIIEGVKYYTGRETAQFLDRTAQTVVNWDKQSDILEARGDKRLIPKPLRLGTHKRRYWTKEDIEKMQIFKEGLRKRGDMKEYNAPFQPTKGD